MNLIYYIFFIVYFFSTSNQVDSRLSHVKVTHRNGAKIYTVGGKKFKTFRNAHSYNKKRSRLSKRKPIRRPTRRLTRKNTRRQTNRIINRRPTSRSNRFPPPISRHQPTPPPIIATTTKVDEIAEKIKAYYEKINEYRKIHKADPLKVSPELVKKAEECAKNKGGPKDLTLNVVRNFAILKGLSENPVEGWYSLKENHDYDKPQYKDTSDPFIHLVWKSATDIGCGMTHDEDYYVCCYFSPVEKVTEEEKMKENVLQP